ncbi:hypothetical protein BOSEA31B_14895 [Hyphomicrobiales bacterium]|nr:hypothetical protein BOSEA31B_14895 [Hyphomicrobiales bacterium]CAH1701382.1 hypothetical protein BOSEA1005_21081 [Hyphomicrobiales bacterium]CAI0345340.1 hypothetical protein BO1005MUT1_390012 [Hyphomicrobiales bacterium]
MARHVRLIGIETSASCLSQTSDFPTFAVPINVSSSATSEKLSKIQELTLPHWRSSESAPVAGHRHFADYDPPEYARLSGAGNGRSSPVDILRLPDPVRGLSASEGAGGSDASAEMSPVASPHRELSDRKAARQYGF